MSKHLNDTISAGKYDAIFTMLIFMLLVILPCVALDELMQGTLSGKLFIFLCWVIVIYVIHGVRSVAFNPLKRISFSHIDIAFFVWIGYIVLNVWIQSSPITNRLLELFGLAMLYSLLRQLALSRFVFIFIALALGGVAQAVIGNLQLWGISPSHHTLFKITGSFFNPGPFAGFLASVFPAIVGLYLFRKDIFSKRYHQVVEIVAGLGGAFVLMVLVPSGSRAALLSVVGTSILLVAKRYSLVSFLKAYFSIKVRRVLPVLIAILFCIAFVGLVKMKEGSAYGRLFIWEVSAGIVKDYPLFGVGLDGFKNHYMNYQAMYFENSPDSPKALLAGDTNYCFNAFLQHAVENGVVGLTLLLFVLVSALFVSNKNVDKELYIAKVGIVGIGVFALFSYPAQILPIKVSLICYLAYIALCGKMQTVECSKIGGYIFKSLTAAVVVSVLYVSINWLPLYYSAWKNWNKAYELFSMKNYEMSITKYEEASPLLMENGDFLTHYGKALSVGGQYAASLEILQLAALRFPNIVVYSTLGESYEKEGRIQDAEQAYLRAVQMNPSRLYSQYLLAKLYDKSGQDEKAIALASKILESEVKVHSTAVNEIRAEMKGVLDRDNR